WSMLLGASPPVPGVLAMCVAVAGLALAIVDRHSIFPATTGLVRQQRLAVLTLVAAVAVPVIAMGLAFSRAQVPLSPHDGASHTEAIQAHRLGLTWMDWYPP